MNVGKPVSRSFSEEAWPTIAKSSRNSLSFGNFKAEMATKDESFNGENSGATQRIALLWSTMLIPALSRNVASALGANERQGKAELSTPLGSHSFQVTCRVSPATRSAEFSVSIGSLRFRLMLPIPAVPGSLRLTSERLETRRAGNHKWEPSGLSRRLLALCILFRIFLSYGMTRFGPRIGRPAARTIPPAPDHLIPSSIQ